MKNKKHIDQLFKDRFKDFEASPSPEVWGSIQTSLESRKKNRKIIPLFWKVGGVAALLALLFTIGNSIYNTSKVDSSVVTNDETTEQGDSMKQRSPLIQENHLNNIEVASEEEILIVDGESVENSSEKRVPSDVTKKLIQKEAHYNTKSEAVSANTSEKKSNRTNNLIKPEGPIVEKHNEAFSVASEEERVLIKYIKKSLRH